MFLYELALTVSQFHSLWRWIEIINLNLTVLVYLTPNIICVLSQLFLNVNKVEICISSMFDMTLSVKFKCSVSWI